MAIFENIFILSKWMIIIWMCVSFGVFLPLFVALGVASRRRMKKKIIEIMKDLPPTCSVNCRYSEMEAVTGLSREELKELCEDLGKKGLIRLHRVPVQGIAGTRMLV